MNNWFEVDKNGLKQLQAGKSKTFIINELTQNAWDQNITFCEITLEYDGEFCTLHVRDDDPEGFKDITHAYTLFAYTSKRDDPTKRGRFNLGEKQVLSICHFAKVTTTKGTVIFDDFGRHETKEALDKGSIITVVFKATKREFEELLGHTETLLPPTGIKYIVNNKELPQTSIFRSFKSSLLTEVLKKEVMKPAWRETTVDLVENDGQSWIYEMGIPVVKTDCPWHINIQQKIPLAVDRETIRLSYLKNLYAQVLNNVVDILPEEEASSVWVRTASKDDKVSKEAMVTVMKKRFGDKFLIRSPFDSNANDTAISEGYTLISGPMLSRDEWSKIKGFNLIQKTTDLFGGIGIAQSKDLDPTEEQSIFADFSKKVAKEFLGVDISVQFVNSTERISAKYGGRRLTFNTKYLPKDFFKKVTASNIDLLVHELGHEKGHHTDMSYHKCITRLTGQLTMKALREPTFFEVN